MSVNDLNVRRTINASGRMSILGVSTISSSVAEQMRIGGQRYYEMAHLHEEAGRQVAKYIGTEAAMVTNSASASIVLAVASVIAKDDAFIRANLHDHTATFKRDILIMKGHNVDYGAPVETMIQLGAGLVKEAGYANGCTLDHIQAAITEETAGFIYIKSHHCVQKNMPAIEEIKELCRKRGIPFIIDIAAEEAIDAYSNLADLLILSGSKALEGPTSGILAGKKEYVDYATLHSNGIGRAMKVGKEAIFGLLQALDEYSSKGLSKEKQLTILDSLQVLNEIEGVSVTISQDPAGREIYRARITVDHEAKLDALQLVARLKEGEIAVYTRDYHANVGYIEIDPRPLLPGDIDVIVEKIRAALGGKQ